jgi:hypothetical protein
MVSCPAGWGRRPDEKPFPLLVAAVLLLNVGAASAASLEDAIAAYHRGDYATALAILRPLAAQGNATAQSNLGLMYAQGHGVARDHARAAMGHGLPAKQIPGLSLKRPPGAGARRRPPPPPA